MGDAKSRKQSDQEFLAWVESLGDPGGTVFAAGRPHPPASATAVRAARQMVGGHGASEATVARLASSLERFKQAVGGSDGKRKAPRKAS